MCSKSILFLNFAKKFLQGFETAHTCSDSASVRTKHDLFKPLRVKAIKGLHVHSIFGAPNPCYLADSQQSSRANWYRIVQRAAFGKAGCREVSL